MANTTISQLSAANEISANDLLLLSKEDNGNYLSRSLSIGTLSAAISQPLQQSIGDIETILNAL